MHWDKTKTLHSHGPPPGPGNAPDSAREQVQVGGEALGHLRGPGQLGVADDYHAVGDKGGPPVAPRRAHREQVDRGHVVAVLGQQPVQAFVVRGL